MSERSRTQLAISHRSPPPHFEFLTATAACSKYQDEKVRSLSAKRVQCDEIWSFVGSKEKNTTADKKAESCGDCWTWTALDADTKLILSFRLGDRTLATAYDFMHDVPSGSRTGFN
jgi:hypothetical protein